MLLVLLSATALVEGSLVNRNFANFSTAVSGVKTLVFLGDASIVNATGPPRVVLNSMTGTATAGRVLLPSQVQFKEMVTHTFASFSTNFTFAINNLGNESFPVGCGGFAFQIQADNSTVGQSGQYLGLTTASSDGAPANALFAVEFDTSQDVGVGDPSGAHLGLDLNSVKSTSTFNLCPIQLASNCITLVNNGVFFAKISYNSTRDSLQVELRRVDATENLRSWTIENTTLQSVFKESMYVGFSGSNGIGCNQTHEIFSWGFSTSRPFDQGGADGPAAPSVSYNCYRLNGCDNYRALVIGLPVAVGGSAILALLLCLYCCYMRKKPTTSEYAAVENKSGYSGPKDVAPVLAGKALDVEAPPAIKIPPTVEPKAAVANRGVEPGNVVLCCVPTKPHRDYKEPVVFSLKELTQATKNFSEKQLIGGAPEKRPVYKGVLRDNGSEVAIKELRLDNISNEFLSKGMVLGRIRHPNLVHLLGWCKREESSKLYLVYEYMPKGSLDKLLLLDAGAEGFLGFDARQQVLMGVAAGLTYLHEEWEQCVLHRDVKPSNVLLDAAGNAHLGNFSHASLVDHNKLAESTVMDGTLGYMAPELPFTGKPTVKSDVFSYGILTLVLACGRLPLDFKVPSEDRVLLDSVWRAHEEGDILRTVDKRLSNQTYTTKQMTTLLQVGLACAHPDPSMRPNMASVWQILIGRAPVPELPATKPVVQNYTALSSLGLIRPPGSRSLGSTSNDQPRFSGMEIS